MARVKTYVLGIDVAKDWLECAASDRRKPFTIANTDEAIAELVDGLESRQRFGQRVLVVVEASGGQENRLRRALDRAGIAIHVGNAKRIRNYARAVGWMAKTDRIDASLLHRYGENENPRPTPAVDAARQELIELLTYRDQLQNEILARQQQLKRYTVRWLRQHAEQALAELKAENQRVTDAIAEAVQAPAFADRYALLRSCPGIGLITAAALLAYLPELGHVSDKQIASLAGLAPFPHDSGQLKGRRITNGGRGQIRNTLYMAATIASRHNQPICALHQRLIERGKPVKVARVAAMRKLLTTLNAMIRDQTPWQPDTTKAHP